MAINTPPITSGEYFSIRSRSVWREVAASLDQRLIAAEYRIKRLESIIQEQQHLARMNTRISDTQYSYAVSAQPSEAPAKSEHVQPGDISHIPTHDLPPVESVGEDEDSTAIHQAVSKAARVTSHRICREHPVMDLLTALSEHVQSCRQGTSVIISNKDVGELLSQPLTNFPGIKLRYNGLLRDDEFLCASYEDGGHGAQIG